MNSIQVNARFADIPTGNLARFKTAAAEALLAHIANVGDAFGRLVELSGRCELEMFGDPSAQLVDATAGLQRSLFSSHFQGK